MKLNFAMFLALSLGSWGSKLWENPMAFVPKWSTDQ